LYGTALELALDISGMHRLAGILDHGIARDLGSTGFLVDLDIADMRGEADTGTVGGIFVMAGDRTAGARRGLGDFLQRERREVAGMGAGRLGMTVLPGDRLFRDAPGGGSPLAELLHGIARRHDAGHAGRKGRAAAIGHVVVAEGTGVGDD